MRDEVAPRSRGWWLAAILLVAAALRSYELSWGLPRFVFFDSVVFYLRPAADLLNEGRWAPQNAVHTPAMAYLVAGLGALLPDSVFGLTTFESGARLAFVGRLATVVFSTASVGAAYLLGRRLVGARAALLGAAAFALSPLHVLEAHRTHSDALMILLGLLAAHQAVLARDRGRGGPLLWAFALVGLSGGAKYTGLMCGAVPAWIALTWPGEGPRQRLRRLFFGCLATLGAFLFAILPLLLSPGPLVRDLSRLFEVAGVAGRFLGDFSWWTRPYLYPLVAALPYVLGWTVYVCGLAGAVSLCRLPAARGPFLAATVPFFLIQGAAETGTPRYYLWLAPFLAIAAGHAIDRVWAWRRTAGPVLAAVVIGYTAVLTASHCARIEGRPGGIVLQAIRERVRAERSRGRRLKVGYPAQLQARYDPVGAFLLGRKLDAAWLPPFQAVWGARDPLKRYRAWIRREQPDLILVTSWLEGGVARGEIPAAVGAFVEALESGELGFEKVEDVRTEFFTQDLYLWADPTFDTVPVVGVYGYKLFEARRPAPPGHPTEGGPAPPAVPGATRAPRASPHPGVQLQTTPGSA